MLHKKSIGFTASILLIGLVGFTSMIYGIGERCLSLDAIGCMKIGERCLMYCKVTIDNTYRLNNDVPILVVKERGSETVIVIEEMDYLSSIGDCDEYEARPEVPCDEPYDIAVYINETSGEPILSEPNVVCP
jgi:hypothetical protein